MFFLVQTFLQPLSSIPRVFQDDSDSLLGVDEVKEDAN